MSLFAVTLLVYFASWLVIPHLLLQRKRPAETLAWLWAILLFPYLGIALYLVIGTDRFKRRRLRRRAEFLAFRGERKREPISAQGFASEHELEFARQISRLNDTPVTRAEGARLLHDAPAFYEALTQRIEQARHHAHVQFFIWRADVTGDCLREVLVAAAQRGVSVRVLLDEVGSFNLPSSYFDALVAAGGEFSCFNTLSAKRRRFFPNLRNHRKLQIIDGQFAFVGGMNVGDEYKGLDATVGPWRDLQIELDGAVASVLQESFADDWYFATGRRIQDPAYYPNVDRATGSPALIVTGGPDSPRRPVQKSTVAMIAQGRKRVWLMTGYFVPNETLITALQLSAARGVDVRLLISEKSDHPFLLRIGRSYYEELLRAGVRVYEYDRALNHTKAAVVDDQWAMVGSANLDNRSMRLNFELNILLSRPEIVRELAERIASDLGESEEIRLDAFLQRSRKTQLFEAACRPFAPLL